MAREHLGRRTAAQNAELVQPERPLPERYAPHRDYGEIDDGDVAPLRAALRHQLGRTNEAALAAAWSVTDALGHPAARRDFAAAVMAIADPRWADSEAGLDDRLREPNEVPPPVALVYRAAAVEFFVTVVRAGAHSIRPARAFVERDVAFADACGSTMADNGGELRLPDVPALPRSVHALLSPTFGWVRLARASSSGSKLHDPNCQVLKANRAQRKRVETMPLWHVAVALDQVCGRCGGPGVVPDGPWFGFRSAADVWAARGGGPVEGWQVRALLLLVGSATMARARAGEPERTFAARAYDALAPDVPDEGELAYRLVASDRRGAAGEAEAPSADAIAAARRLAYRRLSRLAEVIPATHRPVRPEVLTMLDGGDGSSSCLDGALRDWWVKLERFAKDKVPALPALVFGVRHRPR